VANQLYQMATEQLNDLMEHIRRPNLHDVHQLELRALDQVNLHEQH
jgi:hypothetical protein